MKREKKKRTAYIVCARNLAILAVLSSSAALSACGSVSEARTEVKTQMKTEMSTEVETEAKSAEEMGERTGESELLGEMSSSAASQQKPFGVELEAKNVTSEGMTLVCRQSDELASEELSGQLQTGTPYFLEKKGADGWIVLDPVQDFGWQDIALLIPEGETVEWEIDWSKSYGTLPEGQYRIGKEIMEFRAPGDYDTVMYYVEFVIEK